MPVCRICLGRDRKLYDIELCNLKTSYETLTNYWLPEDGLSRKLCWECRARLLACARFREKALHSQALLAAMAPFNQYDITQKLDSLYDQKLNLTSSLTAVHLGPLELCTTCSGVDNDESVFVIGRGATEDALMQAHRNMPIKKEENNESMSEVEDSDLYEEHKVKPDLVLGSDTLQPQDIAFGLAQQPETPAAVITSQCQIQNKEKTNEEAEIAKAHPAQEVQNNAGVKPFKCSYCSYTSSVKSNLLRHERTHTGEKPYKCNICDYKAADTSSLKIHLMSVHAGVKPFKCSHCSYTSSDKRNLLSHERTHTGEKPYKCDLCDYKAAHTSNLKVHLKSVHAGVNSFKCSHCSYTSSNKSNVLSHERTHTGEKPYKCDICDYRAAHTSNLKVHIKNTHAGVKPFKCSHCSYTSSQKNNLQRHERTHNGEKPYKCYICDFKTATTSNLKVHLMSVHAGVKPFKCSQCSYTSSRKSNMSIHERTHTGEKPYKCDICGYKAAHTSNLKVHLKSAHAGVKPFKCSQCSYTSSRKSNISIHERTHTGEKPYKCDICGYEAAHTSNLKVHLKSVHADVKPFNFQMQSESNISIHEQSEK